MLLILVLEDGTHTKHYSLAQFWNELHLTVLRLNLCDSVSDLQSHIKFVFLAAGEVPGPEPEQADKHNPGTVQPADLQSSRLPRRGQHGAQVRD